MKIAMIGDLHGNYVATQALEACDWEMLDAALMLEKEIGQTGQLSFVDSTGKVLLTGDMVATAEKQVGAVDEYSPSVPYVALEFNEEGTKLFAEATEANMGKVIHIVMDEEVISSPVVQTVITDGQAMITGQFGGEEAEELASLIRAGSLPFDLNILQMKNVGARLGADALSGGIKAGMVGVALVLIFMVAKYKLLGLAADWALIIYIGSDFPEPVPCYSDTAGHCGAGSFGRYGGRCQYRYF